MPPEEARVSVFDRGFMFGDAIYEVMVVFDSKIFLLDEHLIRLNRSLEAIRLESPVDDDGWRQLLDEAVRRGGEKDGYLYLQVTRGVEASRSHIYSGESKPTVLITMTAARERGVKAPVRAVTKVDFRWQRADIKVTSLIANGMLKNEALAEGYDEAILVRDGEVTEATAANVFIVKNGVIRTPAKSEHLLHGVTRDHIVKLATEAGLPIEEGSINEADLMSADEVWISSTGNEIRPVIQINDQTIGNGSAGAMCQELNALYQASKNSQASSRA